MLYVLDEPSIGLHHRDNDRLLQALESLRDLGNTVLVVEHDEDTIRRADYVIDLGPGAGRHGGEVVASGTPREIENFPRSLTGQYISGQKQVMYRFARRQTNGKAITILGARENNLKQIDVSFPLGVMTVVTGVSGSGKSTLVNDILYRALAKAIYRSREEAGAHKSIAGTEFIDKVIRIDQSPIGRTPRSNPATYTGVFTQIRDLYAMLPGVARARLQGGALLVQRGGRTLRGLPGRRTAAHRDELPARRVRAVRSVRRQALQPRDAGGEVQGLLDRRPAGDAGGRCAAGAGEHSADQAEAADAGGCRAGIHSPGAVGGDAVGRRGAAHQAGARAEQAADGQDALPAGRAHDRACTSTT